MLMKPGATNMPRASISVRAAAAFRSPIAAMNPLRTATSASYRGLPLPNYTPFAAGRFGWGARTGGLNDNHWVDDIKISLNTQPAAGPTMVITRTGQNITITWPGGVVENFTVLEHRAVKPGMVVTLA